MSDPDPILAKARPLEALLLDSARDDAPPPELLGRTLARVGVASAAAVAASAAATTASAAAPVAASGGLLGAIGIGALVGLLTVGFVDQVIAPAAPPQRASVVVAPAAPPPLSSIAEAASAAAPRPALTSAAGSPEPPSPPRAPSAAAPSAARGGAATLPAELVLLDEARSALAAGDRARGLAALDRYAREFPAGQLANEAGVLRAEASGGSPVSIP